MSKQKSTKRGWRITVFDGTKVLLDFERSPGLIGEAKMKLLMQTLVAKHGLSDDEIIREFTRRKSRQQIRELDIRRENRDDRRETWYYCGSNPHAVMRPVDLSQ